MVTAVGDAQLSFADPARLVRQMSHDMRGPLNAITATSDMFMEAAYGELTEKQQRAMQRIQRNGSRLTVMLDHFSLYVKANSGTYESQAQAFDPRLLLGTLVSEVCKAAAEFSLEVTATFSSNTPAFLTGDREAVCHICAALLWNAVAFTEAGSIHVDSKWAARKGWSIRVTDSGTGIEPQSAPHVFVPFYRGAQPVHAVPTAGCGLGLAVAKALTDAMNGRLALESTSPTGSTFLLTLPLKK